MFIVPSYIEHNPNNDKEYPWNFLSISFRFEVIEVMSDPVLVIPFQMARLSGSP